MRFEGLGCMVSGFVFRVHVRVRVEGLGCRD